MTAMPAFLTLAVGYSLGQQFFRVYSLAGYNKTDVVYVTNRLKLPQIGIKTLS